ncbi:chromosome partitioning protein ParB (plasmid) [Arthrobacter sp. ERGS1:01]|uniref:ParB/RepB/Spo0J family partition protein n=1 Tax=Arthrobacter sp. ERGS1:01 TaxID=1704044 RepID=UPI0006B5ABA0|nr:ParB/RepB/Spo0J family partition protein [Arthrobacter sp. ERGS1:01]ALE04779.1 chromosome partitioning protein ParB [Arthrobacter sp. ERGS1:01]
MTAVSENPVATATELLDPTTLTVDTNVRKEAALTPEFVASIKEHGVLVPVVGHRAEDGTVHVQMGQRRTLAAVEVGLTAIPVHVVATREEADRLATQVVENEMRRALTDADRADAYHQMSLLGVSATMIARRTGAKKATVQTALAVKANETAAAALAQGLTLEQSVVIAEFSANPEEANELEKAALENPGNFVHKAQRMRDDRATAALIATATAEAEAKGLTVLEENPNGWDYKGPAASIYDLTTAEGEKLTGADADAVYLNTGYSGISERLCVADWKARGLRKGGKPAAGGMTEEEKLARRTTIENNKAADSAEVVRREFLVALLSRKTVPKDTARFIAHTLTHSSYLVAKGTNYAALTATLLGCGADRGELQKHLAKATVKPEMVSLAIMITAYEASIDRTSWRHEDENHSYYLKQLAVWGYSLSDVEKLMSSK